MKIEVNPHCKIEIEQFADGYTCVFVDDFLADPESVVSWVCERANQFYDPVSWYPGRLLKLGPEEMSEIYSYMRRHMSKIFSFLRGRMKMETLVSMATLQPEQLSNLQRLCHSDSTMVPGNIHLASVVYLFKNEELGGTAFFRENDSALLQHAKSLEMQDPEAALALLRQYYPDYQHPAGYMTESNELAELVGVIPARFNRMVFYLGSLPHGPYIRNPKLLSDDFASGRLTLNSFFSAKPI